MKTNQFAQPEYPTLACGGVIRYAIAHDNESSRYGPTSRTLLTSIEGTYPYKRHSKLRKPEDCPCYPRLTTRDVVNDESSTVQVCITRRPAEANDLGTNQPVRKVIT